MGFFLIPKISAANHGISIVGEKMGKRAIWVIVTQIAQLFSVRKIPFHFVLELMPAQAKISGSRYKGRLHPLVLLQTSLIPAFSVSEYCAGIKQ